MLSNPWKVLSVLPLILFTNSYTKNLQLLKYKKYQFSIFAVNSSKLNYLKTKDIDGIDRKVRYYDSESDLQPLVILMGTGQTIESYFAHIKKLSNFRRVIIVELRGQGKTELLTSYCSIDQQVKDCEEIFSSLSLNKFDLVGFSFGGRVSLAYSSLFPNKVSKLSLTGVPYVRSGLGKAIIKSWSVSLANDDTESCAWSMVINGFSDAFLDKNYDKLSFYVDSILSSNDPKRLFDLINLSHIESINIPSFSKLAQNIQCRTQVIGCKYDRIANLSSCKLLADNIPNSQFEILESAHLAPFEEPNIWRNLVINFLNQ